MITIEKKDFLNALTVILPAVTTKTDLPILNAVLLTQQDGQICLTANNLMMMIQHQFTGDLRDKSLAVPAATLHKILSLMADDQVEIDLELEHCNFTLKNSNSFTTLRSLAATEFPRFALNAFDVELTLKAEVFATACKRVLFAVSHDPTRIALQGVLFKLDADWLTLVAVDGFQLVQQRIKLPQPVAQNFEIIVPATTLRAAVEIAQKDPQDLLLQFSTKSIGVKTAQTYWVSQLIDAKFPDYQKLLSEKPGTEVSISVESLWRACRGANIFAAVSSTVSLTLNAKTNSLKVYAAAAELGVFDVDLNAQIIGEDLKVSFNNKFLLGYLQHAVGDLQINFLGGRAPCVFKMSADPEHLYILMALM